MKRLYKKGTVHPSPPPVSDQLAFLPAAILTLAAALSPADKEVLSYLISCSERQNNTHHEKYNHITKNKNKNKKEHASPVFDCDCFSCYTCYWLRWDLSENRQVIHQIIDAFEDGLMAAENDNKNNKGLKGVKKDKKKKNKKKGARVLNELITKPELITESCSVSCEGNGELEVYDEVIEEEIIEKGSVRKFVSYIGEKFWGVWN